jgi:hypothetical protein
LLSVFSLFYGLRSSVYVRQMYCLRHAQCCQRCNQPTALQSILSSISSLKITLPLVFLFVAFLACFWQFQEQKSQRINRVRCDKNTSSFNLCRKMTFFLQLFRTFYCKIYIFKYISYSCNYISRDLRNPKSRSLRTFFWLTPPPPPPSL